MYEVYEIPGKPVPLARHRQVGKHCYDPQRHLKKVFRELFSSIFNEVTVIDVPIKVVLVYHMPIPRSATKRRRSELLKGAHFIKPDLSNLIKFTEDVFNGVIWRDDSIICQIEAYKIWDTEGKTVVGVLGLSEEGGPKMPLYVL